MHFTHALIALWTSVATASTSKTHYKHFDCDVGLHDASAHFNETIRQLALHQKSRRPHYIRLSSRTDISLTIDTYFHVVTKNFSAGSITPTMVSAQLKALNTAYTPYGIAFSLVNTSYTINDSWAVGADQAMSDMKSALRQGTYSDLNIYFQTDLTGGILGTCTLPTNIGSPPPDDESIYSFDGCNVQANSMPGGNIYGFNLGRTAVHEVGHWLGLLHTFEGYSCSGNGDFISDTPVQSTSTDGCPVKPAKDSCPKQAGVDPIHNYMDYSDDACYNNFTPGQVERMRALWAQYRQGK